MSNLNFNIEAEFDLKELEKAKKRMEEIEDVFLKLVKLSKIDFAKSFEKFNKISADISSSLTSIPGLVWTLIILGSELAARAAAYLLDWFQYNKILKEDMSAIAKGAKNDKEIMEALQLAIQQGIEGSKELYDVLFEISKQPKLPDIKNIGGFTYFKDSASQLKGWVEAAKEVMNTEYGPLLNLIISVYKDQEYWAKLAALGSKTVAEELKRTFSTGYDKNVTNFADATSELASKTNELNVAQQYGLKTQDMASQKAMELVNDFKLLKQAGLDDNLILDQMKEQIKELTLWFDAFGKTAPAAFEELKQKSEAALPSFRQFLAEGKLGDLAHLDTSKQYEEIEPPSTDFDFEIEMPEKSPGISLKGFMGSWWGDLKKGLDDQFGGIVDSFQAGGIGGALGGLFGFGGEGKGGGIFGALGSMAGPQGGIVGTMQKFASMIPGIGGMVSNLIGGVSLAVKGLIKLFGGLSEEAKVAKDVTRDLGVEISKDLAKKIAETSKDMGDRFTAVTLHLGDIMRETDITADNFDTFASRARDVFSLLETGMIDSAQATSTLNDVFPQLAEEADKLGITFNKNMIDMIRLSQNFGLEVEAISAYVEEKLSVAISGIGDFIKDINTHLFLFIKHYYSLQHRYAKVGSVGAGGIAASLFSPTGNCVGTGLIPVRAVQWDAFKY